MSWTITGTQRYQPAALLDQFPGAAAAYSLRNLVGTSNPAVVRVRRDNDDAEQDFTATEVSDGTLAAWVGAGNNGFVRTWYDQSGNGNNAGQSNTSRQPRIVTNGLVEIVDGSPAIFTNDSTVDSEFGLVASIVGFQSFANLSVHALITPLSGTAQDSFNNLGIFQFGDSASNALLITDATGFLSGETIVINFNDGTYRRLGANSTNYTRSANSQSLFTSYHLATGTSLYVNGNAITLNLSNGMTASTPAAPVNTLYTADDDIILGPNSGAGRPMRLQEYIFFDSDQAVARAAIEANINAHYSIYP
jgi:hypothetical protein